MERECKSMKMELKAVQSALKSLKRKQGVDTTRFMEWDGDESVDWICWIEDGRFDKYEDG